MSEGTKKAASKRKRKIKIRFALSSRQRPSRPSSTVPCTRAVHSADAAQPSPQRTTTDASEPCPQERDALSDVFCNFPERFAKQFKGEGHEVRLFHSKAGCFQTSHP